MYDRDKLFATIVPPQPGPDGPTAWSIDVDRWGPADPNEPLEDSIEDYRTMTGQSVLRRVFPARPSAEVGSLLEDTEFIVTSIGED